MVCASSSSKGRPAAPWGCSRTNCIQRAVGSGHPLAQGLTAPDPHVRPEAPVTGVWPCQYGDTCLKRQEHLNVRGCVHCRRGGANVGAGTGGILEYRQGCSANAAPRPNPALVTVLLRSAMPDGGPSLWQPHGKGLEHSGSVYWRG